MTGLLGLTALIGLVNGAVYELVDAALAGRRPSPRRLAAAGALFLAVLAYGWLRVPALDRELARARRITVALIQTNLGARDKAADPDLVIARHQAMSRATLAAHPEVQLVVWPETAYGRWIARGQRILSVAGPGVDRPMLWGALTYRLRPDGRPDTFNTALLTSAAGEVLGTYDKIELLLFGERLPLADPVPAIRAWFPRTSTFTAGTALVHLRLGETTFLPTICYEDILPRLVRRLWRTAGPASALVNLTNDSWYGDSHEPLIHLALASFRSIETRRALVRATNTGISALVDPAGRITARTGQWRQEVLVGQVPLLDHGRSTIYMRVGDVVGWLAWLGVAAAVVVAWRRPGIRP